ncbi:ATP-binding protein [Cognatilysobacter lacus]|nr:ATP-binding protein [Lysobacter lacus]
MPSRNEGPASAADLALHRLDVLARAGEVLASSLDYEITLQHVAQLCVPELGDLCVVDVVENGVLRRVATAHVLPQKRSLVHQMTLRNPRPGESPAPAGRVLASGASERLDVVTPDVVASHTKDAEHAALIRAIGMRSHVAVPMRAHGDVIGVLSVGITETDRRFDDADQRLVEEIARRAAFAVENARLYRSAQAEIARREQAEAALQLSEQRFRAITEQSPLSTQRLSPDGRTISVNAAWERLWGLTADVLGDYSVLTDPQLEEKGITPLLRLAFAGTPTALPVIPYDPTVSVAGADERDDATRWIGAYAYPVRDDEGAIREVVLVHQDVTDTRRAESKLRASEDRLNRALAAGELVVWDWDLATNRVECSQNATNFFGIDMGQLGAFLEVIHPEDLPRVKALAARALETGIFDRIEYRLRRSAGRPRWMQSRGHAEFDDDGRAVRMLGVTVDVSDRRIAEESVRVLADAGEILGRSLDYQATLGNLARVVVPRVADWFAVDLLTEDGELERVSVHHPDPARVAIAREVFERYPPRRGAGAWKVIETRTPDWTADIPRRLIEQGAVDADHARLLLSLDLHSYITVPLVARDTVIGVLTLVHAESGRRYERADVALALELARRAASAVDNARLYAQLQDEHRRKDEFLATLAHELRNPLAPIRTGLALLQADGDATRNARTRAIMERQLAHMVRLIDDLLDLSRVTRGTIGLQRRLVDVGGLVASSVEASRPLIDAAGLTLKLDMDARHVVLDADEARLSQVLTNLLNNAAKFTPRGGLITLRTALHGARVRIEVGDTGIGLAATQLESIFEMFARGVESGAYGGLGIGLTLARRLVDLHGGQLWAESDGPGRGSRFIVELPVSAQRVEAAPIDAVPDVSPLRRVLVVDDNVDAAQTLAALLALDGHEVRCAFTGDAALALLDEFHPDIAFLDIGLPGMSGYDLARHLRADARAAQARLVAVTGWGREQDRSQARGAGFDAHLTKPVDPAAVLALLAR